MSDICSTNYAVQKAITLVGGETINKLEEFYQKSALLENDYKSYALQLIASTFTINRSGDTKKALTELLLGLGFKKANVSKMIGAQQFVNELEFRGSHAADWVKSLPVSTSYELSCLEDTTFVRAWEKSEYGAQPITQKDVAALKAKHDRPRVSARKLPDANDNLVKARKLLTDYPELVAQIDALLAL
jgi:hypothetical protein